MNLKNYAYHYTDPRNIDSILKNGLFPSGGIHTTGVYMTFNPLEFYGWNKNNRKALFGIHLRALERNLRIFPEKKWIISQEIIKPEYIFYIGENFSSIEELKRELIIKKEEFSRKNPRCQYTIRKERIKIYEY